MKGVSVSISQHSCVPPENVSPVLALSDWLMLATLVALVPAYAYVRGRTLAKATTVNRRSLYLRSMSMLWALALVTLFAWWHHGRPFDELGLSLTPGPVTETSGAVCLMALGAILVRLRTLSRWSAEKAAAIREHIGGTAPILPRTKAELYWFFGVALTAGICEELLYRGFFCGVTAPFITPYGAIAASAVVFGLAHAYQGIRGIALTAAIGLFLGAFYFVSGSLVWPIVLHVLIDINGGVSGYLLFRERQETSR
jgi:membrane protease YdiL (CAAX protease family)